MLLSTCSILNCVECHIVKATDSIGRADSDLEQQFSWVYMLVVSGYLVEVLENLCFSQCREQTWSAGGSELLDQCLACCSNWNVSNERGRGLKLEEIVFVLVCGLTVVVFVVLGKDMTVQCLSNGY